MNRHFNPTSARLRATFVAISALITVVIVAAIGGLADHYSAQSALASAPSVIVAQQ